jgi:hypothetical protein
MFQPYWQVSIVSTDPYFPISYFYFEPPILSSLRIEYQGARYHVISRGDRREDIVNDDKVLVMFQPYWQVSIASTDPYLSKSSWSWRRPASLLANAFGVRCSDWLDASAIRARR